MRDLPGNALFKPIPKNCLSVGTAPRHDFDMIRPAPDHALIGWMLTNSCRRRLTPAWRG
jgi:hypothetical protein